MGTRGWAPGLHRLAPLAEFLERIHELLHQRSICCTNDQSLICCNQSESREGPLALALALALALSYQGPLALALALALALSCLKVDLAATVSIDHGNHCVELFVLELYLERNQEVPKLIWREHARTGRHPISTV